MGERENLANLRTLLALERNYLAEERTFLARIRTGIALAIFGPPTNIILVFFDYSANVPLFLNILVSIFFITITIYGIYLALHGRTQLKNIRNKLSKIRKKEKTLIKESGMDEGICDCFLDE